MEERERLDLFLCQAKREHSRLAFQKLCPPSPGGGSEEFYSVQGAGRGQLVDPSRTGWHQGEVSSIINLLVSTSLGVYAPVVSSLHLVGSASCTNKLGM